MTMRERSGLLRSFDPAERDFPLVASAFIFVVVVHGDPRKVLHGFLLAAMALVTLR